MDARVPRPLLDGHRTASSMKILHGEHYFIFVVSIQPCMIMISVQTCLFIDCVIATELQAGL